MKFNLDLTPFISASVDWNGKYRHDHDREKMSKNKLDEQQQTLVLGWIFIFIGILGFTSVYWWIDSGSFSRRGITTLESEVPEEFYFEIIIFAGLSACLLINGIWIILKNIFGKKHKEE